jgi:hypothetical protein
MPMTLLKALFQCSENFLSEMKIYGLVFTQSLLDHGNNGVCACRVLLEGIVLANLSHNQVLLYDGTAN